MDRKNLEYVCSIVAKMIENGAEISRAEDSAYRLLKSFGCINYAVFCLSSLVIVCADGVIVMNRIYDNNLNLSELDRLNTMSRCICSGVEPINRRSQEYPLLCRFSAIILATGSFCVYFGGTLSDAAFSGTSTDYRNNNQSFAENIKYLVCADIYSVNNGRRTFLCTFVARNKQSACNDYDRNNYAFDTRNSNRKLHS